MHDDPLPPPAAIALPGTGGARREAWPTQPMMRAITINAGFERLSSRLGQFCALTTEERLALAGLLAAERVFAPRDELQAERRPMEGLHLIVEGFACRFKLLPDGRRQILGFLLPGDLCDLPVLLLGRMDHSIAALSAVRASLVPAASLAGVMDRYPRLARALWWRAAVEESVTHQWLLNVGYRTAFERVAHLLCEVYWRLEAVGLAQDNQCRFPLTQTELGDALALSAVHINRTLMGMRRAGLVRLHGGKLEMLNRNAMQAAAGFDPGYLHLQSGSATAVPVEDETLAARSLRAASGAAGTHNAG